MQNPEYNTAAERPSLLTVKSVSYVGSIKSEAHSYEVAYVQAHALAGKSIVEVSVGGSSRELTTSEAIALGTALLEAAGSL